MCCHALHRTGCRGQAAHGSQLRPQCGGRLPRLLALQQTQVGGRLLLAAARHLTRHGRRAGGNDRLAICGRWAASSPRCAVAGSHSCATDAAVGSILPLLLSRRRLVRRSSCRSAHCRLPCLLDGGCQASDEVSWGCTPDLQHGARNMGCCMSEVHSQ